MVQIKDKFAFLIHPTSVESLYFLEKSIKRVLSLFPPYRAKQIISILPAINYIDLKNVKSKTGNCVDGNIILLPVLPEHFVSADREKIKRKIIKACKMAQDNGAKIIGLGGFTSIFTNQGEDIADKVKIPITTGNTFTASLVIESIFKASKLLDIALSESNIAILGATGDIGSICTKVFSREVKKMYLIARDINKLKFLINELKNQSCKIIKIINDPQELPRDTNIILTTTSSITTVLNYKEIPPAAIVCDVAIPPNIAHEAARQRRDVLIFEGGLAEMPFFHDLRSDKFKMNFFNNNIFGCLAETIILALEGKFESYSLGRGNITYEKVKEMNGLGKKHGYVLSPFFCSGKQYTAEEIDNIKAISKKKK